MEKGTSNAYSVKTHGQAEIIRFTVKNQKERVEEGKEEGRKTLFNYSIYFVFTTDRQQQSDDNNNNKIILRRSKVIGRQTINYYRIISVTSMIICSDVL